MSRISKNIIPFLKDTTVTATNGVLTVKGPLGVLMKPLPTGITIDISPEGALVKATQGTKLSRSLTGTFAAHIRNMMKGVTQKYAKKLELQGIGYRVEVQGKNVKLLVGFSHPVLVPIPDGIDVVVEKSMITVSGIDKEAVGQFAANVRAIKKPEPYKGKGIRYEGEYVRQKQGKKAAA